jgi:hypothetical protein
MFIDIFCGVLLALIVGRLIEWGIVAAVKTYRGK